MRILLRRLHKSLSPLFEFSPESVKKHVNRRSIHLPPKWEVVYLELNFYARRQKGWHHIYDGWTFFGSNCRKYSSWKWAVSKLMKFTRDQNSPFGTFFLLFSEVYRGYLTLLPISTMHKYFCCFEITILMAYGCYTMSNMKCINIHISQDAVTP